ncbi:actin organization and endocytosis protein [Coemansia sp. RSA 2399]|nr:actin organization and endocytosis protein [Coemansia sp. RSA 2399]KAJ1908278.1 actin organization and endocytosis protein [Coemansia sp. IMI 209127]
MQLSNQGIPPLTFIPATDLLSYAKTFQSNVASGESRMGGDTARHVLMQSKLPVSELGRIWELSDIRHTGSLTMAEFMLAMFLAQSRLRGKMLPETLPPKIRTEVEASMPPANPPPAAPAIAQQAMQMPVPVSQTMQINMPQPMQMNMPQPRVQQQQMSMPMAATPTTLSQYSIGNSGGVASGGNNSAVESVQEFSTRYPDIAPSGGTAQGGQGALSSVKQSFTQNMLGSRAGESQQQWAIGGAERAQYEAIFRRWDPGHRGVLRGDQAREVFAQSGLSQQELAKIWGLADTNNQGELNLNEFSVAMHLIFRRLAGAQVPDALPAELVPRSSKDFMDSLNDMKGQLMFKDIVTSKSSTPAQRSTVSLRSNAQDIGAAKSHTGYNDDDDDDLYSYRSAHRRRGNNGTSASGTGRNSAEPRSQTPQSPPGGSTSGAATVETIDRLRRDIRRRKDDVRDANARIERRKKERAESRVTLRWRIDDIKREIEDIHRSTPLIATSGSKPGDSDRVDLLAKRDHLVSSVNELTTTMPALTEEYKKLASDLVEARKDVATKRNKSSSADAAGAGGGATDMQSRAARLVAERMAALTGQPIEELISSSGSNNSRLGDEIAKIENKHKENLERIESVTSGLGHVQTAMREIQINGCAAAASSSAGIADVKSEEVRELVDRLKRIERQTASPRTANSEAQKTFASPAPSTGSAFSQTADSAKSAGSSIADRLARATTKQERDMVLKEIAEERFRERQRALGLPDKQPEPEPEPVSKPQPKPEPKPEPKLEPKLEPKPEPKPELKPEPKQVPKPEMRERMPVASATDVDLLDLQSEPVSAAAAAAAAASNPFSNQSYTSPRSPPPPEAGQPEDSGKYSSIFGKSLELDYSEDSSEDEWDRDDSSDEEGDADKPAAVPVTNDRDVMESPESSVSFNTAFAKPVDATQSAPAVVPEPAEESNPFLGLLAASAAATSNNNSNTNAVATTAPASTLDALPSDFEPERVRALYPYSGDDSSELDIETGQLVETRPAPSDHPSAGTHAGDGWLYGEILAESDEDGGDGWKPSGKRGWFPKEYAETLGAPGSRGWNKTKAPFGTAKYDYQPQHDDELSITLGDRVRVVDGDMAESWWRVRKLAGTKESGMLPAIYIDLDK